MPPEAPITSAFAISAPLALAPKLGLHARQARSAPRKPRKNLPFGRNFGVFIRNLLAIVWPMTRETNIQHDPAAQRAPFSPARLLLSLR
jgi:hypothetical protein